MILALRYFLPCSSGVRVQKSQPPSLSQPGNEGVAYLGFMCPRCVGDRIGEKNHPWSLVATVLGIKIFIQGPEL